jgi:hypothetical protein
MDKYSTTFWTNSISYRKNSGKDEDLVTYDKSDSQQNFVSYSYRLNDGNDNGKDFEFSSNFIKNFDNEGHKLTIDGSYTKIKIMKIQPLMVSI